MMGFFRSREKPRITTYSARTPARFDAMAFDRDVAAAPFNASLQVMVQDASGAEYRLPFQVTRTDRGWFNADLGTALGRGIAIVGWRRRDFAK